MANEPKTITDSDLAQLFDFSVGYIRRIYQRHQDDIGPLKTNGETLLFDRYQAEDFQGWLRKVHRDLDISFLFPGENDDA